MALSRGNKKLWEALTGSAEVYKKKKIANKKFLAQDILSLKRELKKVNNHELSKVEESWTTFFKHLKDDPPFTIEKGLIPRPLSQEDPSPDSFELAINQTKVKIRNEYTKLLDAAGKTRSSKNLKSLSTACSSLLSVIERSELERVMMRKGFSESPGQIEHKIKGFREFIALTQKAISAQAALIELG